MKSWLEVMVLNNSVGSYLIALATWVGLATVLMLVKRLIVAHLGRWAQKTTNDLDDFLVGLIAQIGWPVFITISLYVAALPLDLNHSIRLGIRCLLIIAVTIRAVLLAQEILAYTIKKRWHGSKANDPSSELMAKNLTGALRWALWILAVIFLLDNLGVKVSTFVAGLGIGGVAVALAAQAVLGDVFSAISILVDKPFSVGDFIIIDELMGTVEYIGLKTTRIRSLHGELLVFSNSDLTKGRIRNYKQMDTRRIAFKIGVVYQTSSAKVKKIPGIIREICAKVDGIRLDRVHFLSFGDFSLIYEIVYFVLSSDYNVYMDKQQEINFQIKEAFEKEGIEFAYPTQTINLSQPSISN